MTDCIKLWPKVVYSQEFSSIMDSILPADQTKCETYYDIHKTMRNIKEEEAVATQVRGFLLKIPMSKIPPVMIAALPTKGDVTAKEISNQLLKIIDMTASYDINLLSLGADVQDIKHAKKTARNQIHYGTRLITFGNSTVHYDQLCDLAKKENSGLCICDVCNVDKQNDRAAFRVFHSQLLGMCQDNGVINLEKLGLFVYLFVLASKKTSKEWYSTTRSFISIQSYYIFKSLAESLVLLIISHHYYYEDYPLLLWEHRIEALEHILQTGDFGMKKENFSATAVRIAYVNTEKFARLVVLSNSETNLYPFIYIDNSHVEMEVEYVDDSTTNFNVNNNSSENEQLVDIANKITQVAQINQHEKLQLSDDDDLFNDESLEQCVSGSIDQINNFNGINYLINNQRRATLSSRVAAPEELLFDDDELDVLKTLNIRESHNAFSRADCLCGIQIRSTVNLDEGSQNRIDRNIANELMRSLHENDSYVESRLRFHRWEMRKHAESIRIPKTIS
ncbi:6746_t:CDS:2, partial [Funneliformis geosporum]